MSINTGEVLKQLRKERGLTMQDVANAIGSSASYIHLLEKGKRKNPGLSSAIKLADFYGVEVSTFIDFDQEQIVDALNSFETKKEIENELEKSILKMKEALSLFNQDTEQSKEEFIEIQKSLLYIQSLI